MHTQQLLCIHAVHCFAGWHQADGFLIPRRGERKAYWQASCHAAVNWVTDTGPVLAARPRISVLALWAGILRETVSCDVWSAFHNALGHHSLVLSQSELRRSELSIHMLLDQSSYQLHVAHPNWRHRSSADTSLQPFHRTSTLCSDGRQMRICIQILLRLPSSIYLCRCCRSSQRERFLLLIDSSPNFDLDWTQNVGDDDVPLWELICTVIVDWFSNNYNFQVSE